MAEKDSGRFYYIVPFFSSTSEQQLIFFKMGSFCIDTCQLKTDKMGNKKL